MRAGAGKVGDDLAGAHHVDLGVADQDEAAAGVDGDALQVHGLLHAGGDLLAFLNADALRDGDGDGDGGDHLIPVLLLVAIDQRGVAADGHDEGVRGGFQHAQRVAPIGVVDAVDEFAGILIVVAENEDQAVDRAHLIEDGFGVGAEVEGVADVGLVGGRFEARWGQRFLGDDGLGRGEPFGGDAEGFERGRVGAGLGIGGPLHAGAHGLALGDVERAAGRQLRGPEVEQVSVQAIASRFSALGGGEHGGGVGADVFIVIAIGKPLRYHTGCRGESQK